MPERLSGLIRSIVAWLKVQYGVSIKDAEGILYRSQFYSKLKDISNGWYFLPFGKLIVILLAELDGKDINMAYQLMNNLK